MPNWCQNILTISHEDAEVMSRLMAQVKEGDGDLFKYIKPMPDDTFHGNLGDAERKMCEEKGIPNWYDWCNSNWGTKWDAANMGYSQHDEHSVSFEFDTAWSPPLPVYEELAKQGFEVEAYYVEFGMDYGGEWHFAGGFAHHIPVDSLDGYIPPELDEAFDITNTLEEWARENEENMDDE